MLGQDFPTISLLTTRRHKRKSNSGPLRDIFFCFYDFPPLAIFGTLSEIKLIFNCLLDSCLNISFKSVFFLELSSTIDSCFQKAAASTAVTGAAASTAVTGAVVVVVVVAAVAAVGGKL